MSNALYGKGRDKFATGSIHWVTDTIKVALIDTDSYAVAIDTHEFLSEVAGAAIIVTGALSGKSSALGVCDAEDTVLLSVPAAPPTGKALIIYKDTGNAATSPLIAYIDTGVGLPITPNGGNETIIWSNSATRIFKL